MRSKKALFASLKKCGHLRVWAAVAVYEHFILVQHWVSEYFHLPFSPEASIEASTDKRLMRELFFKHAPHTTPRFQEIKNEKDLVMFSQKFSFPLILKPANLTKSLLISKSASLDELLKNYRYTKKKIRDVYKREGSLRTPKILVEEFLEGSFHSLAAFVDSRGSMTLLPPVDLVTAHELSKDDTYIFGRRLPSKLTRKEEALSRKMAEAAISALGLRNSAAHVEFVYTQSGPKVIEIGARIGGYRPYLYRTTYGLNILKYQIDLAHGKPTPPRPSRPAEFSAVLEIFPEEEGVLHSIHFLRKAAGRESVRSINRKRAVGERVGPAKKGFRACAIIFLASPKKTTLEKDVDFIQTHVKVRLKRPKG
ncbi:MAG: ATP-grasp domain-containing protein [Candidatus Moraniibacteriota bacterium]